MPSSFSSVARSKTPDASRGTTGGMVSLVRDLAECDESCGHKAANLARLVGAGLPVPAGFALDARAFLAVVDDLPLRDPDAIGHALATAAGRIETAELPAALVRDVEQRALALGGTLVVRSSSTAEDSASGAAPGLFASMRDVDPRDVWAAIRAVWTSALAPIAASYARERGPSAMGVVVQRQIDGALVTVYTRPPGGDDVDTSALWLQREGRIAKIARDAFADDENGRCAALALAAERAIEAAAGADVELVVARARDGGSDVAQIWVVQARPIPKPRPRRAPAPPPPIVLASLEADGRPWTLDAAHNPDPLSPAQAGLVERVERAGFAPWSMRVCGGYLYTAPRDTTSSRMAIRDVAELEQRASEIEARIARVLADEPADLDAALAQYLAFYEIWSTELSPLIAAAKAGLAVEDLAGARPSAVEAILRAAVADDTPLDAIRAKLGALSPAWDVAVPTFGEAPHVLVEALARMRGVAATLGDASPVPVATSHAASIADERRALTRAAADFAERDDFYFATAQWRVRRSLLDRAAALGWADDDIFWIPLDDAITGTLGPVAVRRLAAAGRGASERASQWAMPLVVGAPSSVAGRALHGSGGGGSASGRVCKLDGRTFSKIAVSRHHVVVVRAVTPALAVLVAGAAALVSETGGPLDHGAAMARELGIPFVVGCREAYTLLRDGQLVSVRGDEGIVEVEVK